MEIDLNKEESTEISIFIRFSIRDYVAEIRKKNPVKCWPFGSLRNPVENKVVSSYQSSQSTNLSGQHRPSNIKGSDDTKELTEAPNLSKVVNLKPTEERPETISDMTKSLGVCIGSSELTFCKVNMGQNRHENNVDEGAKIRHNAAAYNKGLGRNRQRRKPHKFRLLSDIHKDPASELRAGCDRTNVENANRRFVAEIEDESDDDDVTLAAYFRKQKGVKVSGSTLNKKRDMIGVEEPSVDQDRKSNHGSKDSIGKDSNVDTSDFRLQYSQNSNQFVKVSTEKENEDSEMEAVMLLAHHFNERKQILRDHNTSQTCACAKKKIRKHSTQCGNKPVSKTSSKTAIKHQVKKITKEKLENAFSSVQRTRFKSQFEMSVMKVAEVCSFNRNPADFSIPNGENKFMRGC